MAGPAPSRRYPAHRGVTPAHAAVSKCADHRALAALRASRGQARGFAGTLRPGDDGREGAAPRLSTALGRSRYKPRMDKPFWETKKLAQMTLERIRVSL